MQDHFDFLYLVSFNVKTNLWQILKILKTCHYWVISEVATQSIFQISEVFCIKIIISPNIR